MKKLVVSLAMVACLVGSADAKCYKSWKYNNCGKSASNLYYSLTNCEPGGDTMNTCGNAGCGIFQGAVTVSSLGEVSSNGSNDQYLDKLATDGAKLRIVNEKCASYYPQVQVQQAQKQAQPELKAGSSSGSSRGMGRVVQSTLPQSPAPASGMGRTLPAGQ